MFKIRINVMTKRTTDTRFFTNDEGGTLLQRFKQTLRHVDKFDVLVGYFRASGFYALYKDLEKVNKIRILNGKDVDSKIFEAFNESQQELGFDSAAKAKEKTEKKKDTKICSCWKILDPYCPIWLNSY